MTVSAIAAVLGGSKTLKRKVVSNSELRSLTREGLPVGTVALLARQLSVEKKTIARAIGISDRTLIRRAANSERLSAEESDRAVRLARVVSMAIDTFGTKEKASSWLQKPNRALQDEIPLELLDTDMGARAVETILMRIDYGVYS